MGRQTAYDWRKADADFAKAWDEALELGIEVLEDEALRRGKDGTLKPVYQQGKKVGTIREFSDTLLIFTLKARRPEKYRERTHLKADVSVSLSKLIEESMKPKEPVSLRQAVAAAAAMVDSGK